MIGYGWVRLGAFLGFLAVGLGAFGAHGLKERLEFFGTEATYQTAAHYHLTHALALLAVGLFSGPFRGSKALEWAGWGFLIGIALFSGSLYFLSVTGIRWLGAITPFGGVAMMMGWVALATAAGGAVPATGPSGWSDPTAAPAPAPSEPVGFDSVLDDVEATSRSEGQS